MTHTMTEQQVLEILKREIRLVCKHANPDDCECIWMVKPGNLEHCAKLISDSHGESGTLASLHRG